MNIQVKPELPPFKVLAQRPPAVEVERKGGAIYLRSKYPLGAMPRSIAHLLEARGAAHRDRTFTAERPPLEGGRLGDWRFATYGKANRRADAIAQALLD